MKKQLLCYCLGLLAPSVHAQTTRRYEAPVDTVAGHAHMVHQMSESMCTKLEEESKRTDFKLLTAKQSDKLVKGLTFKTIGENLPQFQEMVKAVPKRKQQAYGQRLGHEALLLMAASCPTAPRFLADLNYESMEDKSPISAAERAVLLPLAQSTCQRISDELQKQHLAESAIEESKAAIVRALQASFLISAPELMQYYGDDIMDQDKIGRVAERMSLLMFNFCPKSLLMLSLEPAK